MAQQDKAQANGKDQKILQHDIEEIDKKVDEVQQMETSNKDQIVASKSFIYVIIALLVYLIFMIMPDMNESFQKQVHEIDKRITYMEKDLSAVLVQSERFTFRRISSERKIQKVYKSICKRQCMCILSFRTRSLTPQPTIKISKFFRY